MALITQLDWFIELWNWSVEIWLLYLHRFSTRPPHPSPLRCPPFFLFLALPTFVSRASNALIPAYHKQSQHRIHRSLHAAERSICEYLELNGMEQNHFRIIVYTRYVCTILFSAMNNKKRLQYNPSWCLLCFVELCALNERTLLFRREICASVLCGCYQLIWISVVQIEHYWPIAIAIACCVFVFRLRLHKLLLTPVQLCFPSCNWR